jgi:hypothetical protein
LPLCQIFSVVCMGMGIDELLGFKTLRTPLKVVMDWPSKASAR